jgi:hypothetical protein
MSDGKFSHIASLLLPVHARTERMTAYARVLVSPFAYLRDELAAYRAAKLKELRYNGQVASLEYLLNEQFNGGLKGIIIADAPLIETTYLHNSSGAGDPTYLYNASESVPVTDQVYLYNKSEYEAQFSFYVYVPAAIEGTFDEKVMQQVVDFYRPAGRTFTIEYYE